MPRGPKGERRPADVIGNAVKVMRIATGEQPEGDGEIALRYPLLAGRQGHDLQGDDGQARRGGADEHHT